MSESFLSVRSLERRLATGNVELLTFEPGVNVFVGRPNTGKTKWLQTLDFLLGDSGANPYEQSGEEELAEKYDAAAATLCIGGETFRIERRWREVGAKGKVFVGDEGMLARDFQHWLMGKLSIPLVNFPKGNPMSGQTWPELSFRTLLRHIFRQQRFWSGLVDQQADTEQHASLLLFLGLAERIFSEDYGKLVNLKLKSMRLRARREQYRALLQRLAAVRGRLSLCADQAAAAKWWLSMPMASVSAEGPMPKALSTRRTSPLMPGCRHQGRACPLRRARMTSNPLIVA